MCVAAARGSRVLAKHSNLGMAPAPVVAVAASSLFLWLVGWRPWPRVAQEAAASPPGPAGEQQASGAACLGVAAAERPAELLLQRKVFTPAPHERVLAASSDALWLRADLEEAAAAPCRAPMIRPHLANQCEHLGSLLHGLVPLLWQALNVSRSGGAPSLQLPGLASISSRDPRCTSQSLGCLLKPASRCPPPPHGSAARDAQRAAAAAAARGRRGANRGGAARGKAAGLRGATRAGAAAPSRLLQGAAGPVESEGERGASLFSLEREASRPAGFEYSARGDAALPARYR